MRAEGEQRQGEAAPTAAQLLAAAASRLETAGVETARLDAEVLLAEALRLSRTAVLARLHGQVGAETATRFAALVARRAGGEPAAYITGRKEFWSLSFQVNGDVLIPRPETEGVVAAACERIGPHAARVCDVGTGSGCIAVAIAHERRAARVVGLDASAAALRVAAANAAAHGVADRVALLRSDLLEAFSAGARFDVVVSNPPYVRDGEPLPREVLREPAAALRAGADGLDVIRRLIAAAPAHLCKEGWLIVEIGIGQSAAVRTLAVQAGFEEIDVQPDLAGIARVLTARWPR